MRIRSITLGLPLTWPDVDSEEIADAGHFAQRAKAALEAAGLEVQTIRLAAPPLSTVLASFPSRFIEEAAVTYAAEVMVAAKAAGFSYVSLGPVNTIPVQENTYALIAVLPKLIAAHEGLFATAQVGNLIDEARRDVPGRRASDRRRLINLKAAQAAAGVIRNLADHTPDGFGNLNFAATANCPGNIPFFPVAYFAPQSTYDLGSYGLALETADLVVEAFSGASSIAEACTRAVAAFEREGRRVLTALEPLGGAYTFNGLDFSTAPFPSPEQSIGHAFEQLGIAARFGQSGTLFTAAIVTSALQSVDLPRCGYSGLMLPVLEDTTLAQRSAEAGLYNVDSLLLYSAVCGLGLDTVPLPGDVSERELIGILLDMAVLALRLHKPLTARLFPVPGKVSGEAAAWDFPFFAPGAVLASKGQAADGQMKLTEEIVEV